MSEGLEEAEHSPKTQQLIELAGRLAEERGIGDDQTVRFPDSFLYHVGALSFAWVGGVHVVLPACRSWSMQKLEPSERTI